MTADKARLRTWCCNDSQDIKWCWSQVFVKQPPIPFTVAGNRWLKKKLNLFKGCTRNKDISRLERRRTTPWGGVLRSGFFLMRVKITALDQGKQRSYGCCRLLYGWKLKVDVVFSLCESQAQLFMQNLVGIYVCGLLADFRGCASTTVCLIYSQIRRSQL